MFVAKAEAAKAEALQQSPSARLYICTNAQWRFIMATIANLSDKKSKQFCENDTKIMFSNDC